MWGWHGWYMGWMWIFWVALFVVVIWLVFRASGPSTPGSRRETPEEIAKRRYASGEINQDEYQRLLGDLRK